MPELPDIVVLARSMDQALRGQSIAELTVNQPKCLNRPEAELRATIVGRQLASIVQRGKWVIVALSDGSSLALNLGMGGEVRIHGSDEVAGPARERVTWRLGDGRQLWAHFWWFGSVHYAAPGELVKHPQIGALGPEPLAPDFTIEALAGMLTGRRGAIKSYLLDQKLIAGIGNVYVQDTLFRAHLHPLRQAGTISPEGVARLHWAIRETLAEGIRWGGGPSEQDVWGNVGTYSDHFLVGYHTGQPCPECGMVVEQIRTGSTTSYICPKCQQL